MSDKQKVFFIDTNIIRNTSLDHFFGGIDILVYLAETGKVLIPNIVLREIEQQKKEKFKKEYTDKALNNLSTLNKLEHYNEIFSDHSINFDTLKQDIKNFDIDAKIQELKDENTIKYEEVRIIKFQQALEDLQELAVTRKPPFSEKDEGFKDGLFYMTVKEWIDKNSPDGKYEVYIITGDKTLAEAFIKHLSIRKDFVIEKAEKDNEDDFIERIKTTIENNDTDKLDMSKIDE